MNDNTSLGDTVSPTLRPRRDTGHPTTAWGPGGFTWQIKKGRLKEERSGRVTEEARDQGRQGRRPVWEVVRHHGWKSWDGMGSWG